MRAINLIPERLIRFSVFIFPNLLSYGCKFSGRMTLSPLLKCERRPVSGSGLGECEYDCNCDCELNNQLGSVPLFAAPQCESERDRDEKPSDHVQTQTQPSVHHSISSGASRNPSAAL